MEVGLAMLGLIYLLDRYFRRIDRAIEAPRPDEEDTASSQALARAHEEQSHLNAPGPASPAA
jgi:hypothetical protein